MVNAAAAPPHHIPDRPLWLIGWSRVHVDPNHALGYMWIRITHSMQSCLRRENRLQPEGRREGWREARGREREARQGKGKREEKQRDVEGTRGQTNKGDWGGRDEDGWRPPSSPALALSLTSPLLTSSRVFEPSKKIPNSRNYCVDDPEHRTVNQVRERGAQDHQGNRGDLQCLQKG
jgi:hypothetical protein